MQTEKLGRGDIEAEEHNVLVNESRSKPLTGEAHPHAVRRFVVFLITLLGLLVLIIALSPAADSNIYTPPPPGTSTIVVRSSTPSPSKKATKGGPGRPSRKPNSAEKPTDNADDDEAESEGDEEDETEAEVLDLLDEDTKFLEKTGESALEAPKADEPDESEVSEPSQEDEDHLKDQLSAGADDAYEESGKAISGGRAPRTTDIPYNTLEPKVKYVLYNPSGGMSNQEIELVNAMYMAKFLKRTLLVPMVGRHSNLPQGYNALSLDSLFPSDRIYDFQRLAEFVPVVPLNNTLQRFLRHAANVLGGTHNIRLVSTQPHFEGSVEGKHLRGATSPIIFFEGQAMWGRWWGPAERQLARRYVAYSPHLRRLSIAIANDQLGPSFYAIHGRLGDQAYRWGHQSSDDVFVKTPEFRAWNKSLKLYLASDEPGSAFFNPLKKKMNVLTSADLKGPAEEEFRSQFPNKRIRHDMFGVLEKLICAQAIGFLDSPFSTFSLEIKMIRGQIKYVFPEVHAMRHPTNGTTGG